MVIPSLIHFSKVLLLIKLALQGSVSCIIKLMDTCVILIVQLIITRLHGISILLKHLSVLRSQIFLALFNPHHLVIDCPSQPLVSFLFTRVVVC